MLVVGQTEARGVALVRLFVPSAATILVRLQEVEAAQLPPRGQHGRSHFLFFHASALFTYSLSLDTKLPLSSRKHLAPERRKFGSYFRRVRGYGGYGAEGKEEKIFARSHTGFYTPEEEEPRRKGEKEEGDERRDYVRARLLLFRGEDGLKEVVSVGAVFLLLLGFLESTWGRGRRHSLLLSMRRRRRRHGFLLPPNTVQ